MISEGFDEVGMLYETESFALDKNPSSRVSSWDHGRYFVTDRPCLNYGLLNRTNVFELFSLIEVRGVRYSDGRGEHFLMKARASLNAVSLVGTGSKIERSLSIIQACPSEKRKTRIRNENGLLSNNGNR